MYGPPRGCKGKAEEEEKSTQINKGEGVVKGKDILSAA
jgi:hypothetical protein